MSDGDRLLKAEEAGRYLGLTTATDPVKVEHEVCALLPPREWGAFSLRLILHGRQVCQSEMLGPECLA